MAGHCILCLEEARPFFQPRFGDNWLSTFRSRFCLMNVYRSPYKEGGNFFIERLLLSTEKYLEGLNAMGLEGDPSPRYLSEVRLLSRSFRGLIEQWVEPGEPIPPAQEPEWLRKFKQDLPTYPR